MSLNDLPVALTCGEPAGIGPELAAKAWEALGVGLPFFLIGEPSHLPDGVKQVEIAAPEETSAATRHGLPVLKQSFPAPVRAGRPDPVNAASVIEAIHRGVDLVTTGKASALTTGPIQKKVLQDGAGFAFPGHTEYLSYLSGGARSVMLLSSELLNVVPVTIHIPLAQVPSALTPELVEETILITEAAMRRDFGLPSPRLAVTGLNPHAGEAGAIGHEDVELIGATVEKLRRSGIKITGPHAADTMFHQAARAQYDVAIAMYHDQALIPIKTLDFYGGVNVTLGLPFVRTSPDHGTALDIAGKGLADARSTIAALRKARAMAQARSRAET